MLPDETLQESFSFLSHYGLNVAMIVCRRWKRVVYDFEFDDRVYCYYDEWTDSYRREKRARSYRLKAPIRLPHHIHIDGDAVRILNARKYHEDTVRHHVVWSDIDANDDRFSGFEFLELKASLKFGEPSLEGLLDKFPSLRTVQVAEIEYGFPVDGGGISLRRLKEFTYLRQLSITQRESRDEFWLGRADEDGLLDVCVCRSLRLPAKEGRTITVQCLVSRRFLLQLIEAFETIVGSTTVEVYYEHQPTLLEEWLGIEKDYFDYGGPISMKSKLVIKKGSVDHTAVWYKCRDSNVAFAHYRKHFVVTNDLTEVTSRVHRLVNYSLDVEGW